MPPGFSSKNRNQIYKLTFSRYIQSKFNMTRLLIFASLKGECYVSKGMKGEKWIGRSVARGEMQLRKLKLYKPIRKK